MKRLACHVPSGVGWLDLMGIPSVGPEEEKSVEFGLDICKLRFAFWENPQQTSVFLQSK